MDDHINELWQQVHQGLRAFIAKRVGSDAEVEDILQEVFVRVHRNLDRLKEPERLVSWVFQITRHVIIDFYRAPGRRRELPVGLADAFDGHLADLPADGEASPDPEAGSELSRCLQPMLARLSEEYRQAIRLVELEGLTHQEAADRLGLSLSGMKSRVQRGRRQLKELLDHCCVIELDGRQGVIDFERRDPGDSSC